MTAREQLTLTMAVSAMSVDAIIKKIEEKISGYKAQTGNNSLMELGMWCMVLNIKMISDKEFKGDPFKMIDMLEKVEASRKIFETNPQ